MPMPEENITSDFYKTPRDKKDQGKYFLNSKGNMRPVFTNLVAILEEDEIMANTVRLNNFSGDVEFVGKPPSIFGDCECIGDSEVLILKEYVGLKYKMDMSKNEFWDAIALLGKKREYHPIKEYLNSLVWDGKERLSGWLEKAVGCDKGAYYREVGKKILLASVTRIFEPGCKFDTMLVLESPQRYGKSLLVEKLCGSKWFAVLNFSDNDKEIVAKMQGKWFLEVAEMDGYERADVKRIKNFISVGSDRVRLSYRRNAESIPRKSVFVGTMNPDATGEWLKDDENRRFWPIKCNKKIDLSWVDGNRDQLFAEALKLYKESEVLYLDEITHKEAEKVQHSRKIKDIWMDSIEKYCHLKDKVYVKDILMHVLGMREVDIKHYQQIRIAKILKDLEWTKIDGGALSSSAMNDGRYYYVKDVKPLGFNEVADEYNRAKDEELWDERTVG